ncbi:hypothetical protein ACFYXM_35565 [Streptomyces sp. NPDC002476]|uniref:hypothetical protein n=1 Tax=Streptomyces sp. NPDC002476 TaxID=3364648 RepID=UPI0036A10450
MAHTDPYRPVPADGRDGAQDGISPADVVGVLLRVALVISVIGNMVVSYGAAGSRAHLAFGGVTAVCVMVLVVRRLRSRR